MNRKSYSALMVLGLAVLLGIAGDLLLRAEPWGVNAFVAALAFAVGFVVLVRRLELPLHGAALWLWATVPVLAAVLVWRDSAPLMGLPVLGVLLALVGTALVAHRRALPDAGTLVAEGIALGLHAPFGMFRLAGELGPGVVEWAPWNTKAGAVIRGAVLAIPPLLVFGLLFASADEAFARLLTDLIDIDVELFASHVALAGVFTWLAAGWLYWVVLNDGSGLPRSDQLGIRVGMVEARVALGLVIALFVAFIAVQSTYLFGGEALVQATTGLTYAEYARSGFFELVVAAFLVLPLLLVALWLVRDESVQSQRVLRLMAAVLVVLIFVIMASALYRMKIYQEAYGLTHLRFLTTAFIGWLAVIFVLFSATVLRGAPRWFIAGSITTALAAVVLLAVVNPDARIVETNVQRARGGAEFDAGYLRELSADAVPAIVAALPSLPEPGRCAAAHWLVTRWGAEARAARPGDWRTWNYSRAHARRLVREHEDRLRALACPPAELSG
ncbi:MAG TPA: DUF4173 domain-containing protein [Longimicrobiales bacterium]|nr:DUF4173 domain-containing protein [Longimicrobiales bacterium]